MIVKKHERFLDKLSALPSNIYLPEVSGLCINCYTVNVIDCRPCFDFHLKLMERKGCWTSPTVSFVSVYFESRLIFMKLYLNLERGGLFQSTELHCFLTTKLYVFHSLYTKYIWPMPSCWFLLLLRSHWYSVINAQSMWACMSHQYRRNGMWISLSWN